MNRNSEMNEPVALLTMVRTKIEARHAMINALEQSYSPLALYLIYQNGIEHPVAPWMQLHYAGVEVDESVRGDFWHKKMDWFLENVREPITCVWDADDRYENKYVEICSNFLNGHDGVWNLNQVFACNDGLKWGQVQSGWGTLFIRTEKLRAVYESLENKTDCDLRKRLQAEYDIGVHTARRYYFLHDRQHSLPHPITQKEMIREF